MRFAARHRIDGAYSGRHPSRHQGGAGEFVDYREYSGGEDLRRLDWKVFSRTGKAYVRLHQDETNLLCTLALDASRSMEFGGGPASTQRLSKLAYVQYLATAVSHIISRAQDQVGLAVLGAQLRQMIPPGSTVTHVTRIQELIEQLAPEPTVVMAAALRSVFERSRRRGVLLLLTDFLMEDLDDVFSVLRLFRHHCWEVVLLHVVDPDEERLPDGPAYRFEDLESNGHAVCSPADIRAEYRQRFAAHLQAVRQRALVGGCDYRLVSTAVPYLRTLQGFLVERTG